MLTLWDRGDDLSNVATVNVKGAVPGASAECWPLGALVLSSGETTVCGASGVD